MPISPHPLTLLPRQAEVDLDADVGIHWLDSTHGWFELPFFYRFNGLLVHLVFGTLHGRHVGGWKVTSFADEPAAAGAQPGRHKLLPE